MTKNYIPFDADKKPISKIFEDSTPLLLDPEALKARAETKGYLFFKNLLPSEKLTQTKKQILQILSDHELLDKNNNCLACVADVEKMNQIPIEKFNDKGFGIPLHIYKQIQQLEDFHSIVHESSLHQVLEIVFGEKAFPHPRNIARVLFPHKDLHATPSHQDYLYIQGTTETWTCWVPLMDVPSEVGGLAVLEGSHKAGLLKVTAHPGAGGKESILCDLEGEWASTDYQTGDVLMFNSYTVHKARPNLMKNIVRLSIDIRLQPIHQPISEQSLLPHGPQGIYSWDELYEGWTRKDLMYYWKDIQFENKAFDDSIFKN